MGSILLDAHVRKQLISISILSIFEGADAKNNSDLLDLSEVNIFSTISNDGNEEEDCDSLIGLAAPFSSAAELVSCHQTDVCVTDANITDLVGSMVTMVEAEIDIEREIYGLLLEIVNRIEIDMAVREVLDANCQSVELVQDMLGKVDTVAEMVNFGFITI